MSINNEKLAYDLALIYAKEKFSYALKNDLIDYSSYSVPHDVIEQGCLADFFKDAFNEFENYQNDWYEFKE